MNRIYNMCLSVFFFGVSLAFCAGLLDSKNEKLGIILLFLFLWASNIAGTIEGRLYERNHANRTQEESETESPESHSLEGKKICCRGSIGLRKD